MGPYTPETLLRKAATENAELRELLGGVAQELERLAAEHPALASRFLAPLQQL